MKLSMLMFSTGERNVYIMRPVSKRETVAIEWLAIASLVTVLVYNIISVVHSQSLPCTKWVRRRFTNN